MANTNNRRPSNAASNRFALKQHPLALACAAAFLFATNVGHAQDAAATKTADAAQTDAEAAKKAADAAKAEADRKAPTNDIKELDSVEVVGIRAALNNSISTKQDATQIVEVISAEDIGKLPDSSIAESIARLPGLTAQRERGRATQINIRGLSGDFAGTTLNGREQTSTGDNRGVEFDQYPSELLSSVVVYKTPDATLVGQGLSGTVDMRTVRPLEWKERVFTVGYRADQNTVNGSNEYGNRYGFSYIDQFLDNTFGVAFGYAHLDSPQPGFQNESWGYADGPNGTKVIGGGKLYKFDDNLKRDGVMATLQYRPSDFYETTVDLFYSQYDKTEIKSGVEFGTAWGQGVLQPGYTVNSEGTITDSTWKNVKPVIRNDSNPINDQLNSYGWHQIFTVNQDWRIDTDVSYSKTNRDFDFLETYAGLKGTGTGAGTTDLRATLNSSGSYYDFIFSQDMNDPNNLKLIDAGGWGQDGYIKNFEVNDKLMAYRIDATRSFADGWISDVQFGYNYTTRDKDKSSVESRLCFVSCAGVGDSAPYPGSPASFDFGGLSGLASYNAEDLLTDGTYVLQQKFDKDIANKNWTISEDVSTWYAQANIDTEVSGMSLRGNFGFQYVTTDQSSTGYSSYAGNPAGTPTSGGDNQSQFLPSLNLALGMAHEQYVRFAAAKQMARPRMDWMRASYDVGISTTGCQGNDVPDPPNVAQWCGGGGNPQLKPWLANAYDLSYEMYFTADSGAKGYVSAAYFFKQLTSYVFEASVPHDFAGEPVPPIAPGQILGPTYPASTLGYLKQPYNGEGGLLRGLELTVSVPFEILWAPLEGFGIQATYSDTDSTITPFGPGSTQALPGLSRYVSNTTLYYERAGFSIRYSSRTRSKFVGETRGFGGDNGFISFNGEKVQDAQINYNFTDGMFKGLALYLNMSNIGDEPFTSADSTDSSARPRAYFEYGRTTLLGFSYNF